MAELAQLGGTLAGSAIQPLNEPYAEGVYDYAVIAAQTACERMVFDGMTELLDAEEESPGARFARAALQSSSQAPSMTDGRLQALWTALTGDEIQKSGVLWERYRAHLGRRNGVVHRGAEPTKAEATESLDAATTFRAHVQTKLEDVLGR